MYNDDYSHSLIGEIISDKVALAILSMIGLLILSLLLQFKFYACATTSIWWEFLLANMTILFLPPAVGIMDKFLIAPYIYFRSC